MLLGPDWIAGSQGWRLCFSFREGAIMKNNFKRISPLPPGWLSKTPQRAFPALSEFLFSIFHEV